MANIVEVVRHELQGLTPFERNQVLADLRRNRPHYEYKETVLGTSIPIRQLSLTDLCAIIVHILRLRRRSNKPCVSATINHLDSVLAHTSEPPPLFYDYQDSNSGLPAATVLTTGADATTAGRPSSTAATYTNSNGFTFDGWLRKMLMTNTRLFTPDANSKVVYPSLKQVKKLVLNDPILDTVQTVTNTIVRSSRGVQPCRFECHTAAKPADSRGDARLHTFSHQLPPFTAASQGSKKRPA
jgi:hypothetical protein